MAWLSGSQRVRALILTTLVLGVCGGVGIATGAIPRQRGQDRRLLPPTSPARFG